MVASVIQLGLHIEYILCWRTNLESSTSEYEYNYFNIIVCRRNVHLALWIHHYEFYVNALTLQLHSWFFFFVVWDKKMVHTQFKWCWYHVPTFAPYKFEGMFFPLILAHGSTAQSAKTVAIVLQSLTPNAQSVFKILAEYQLSHPDEEGMPFDNLYTTARERFLVSSQVTLNSHLTEFKDHELVKTRRHSDGQDCLYIPLASEALEKLLSDI
ncbi:hypothetical protein Pint_35465 [Pistacia integerrima]|uniref:Uncharacterized protein n=1 Tax=Pistacia integerrima TaxID=434235 RepID=A0ACC0Y3C0_9ROSI|nr:hypothetical protein Pint_35465 [Pistacia integerrima]